MPSIQDIVNAEAAAAGALARGQTPPLSTVANAGGAVTLTEDGQQYVGTQSGGLLDNGTPVDPTTGIHTPGGSPLWLWIVLGGVVLIGGGVLIYLLVKGKPVIPKVG